MIGCHAFVSKLRMKTYFADAFGPQRGFTRAQMLYQWLFRNPKAHNSKSPLGLNVHKTANDK